jgi:hypothetical protein
MLKRARLAFSIGNDVKISLKPAPTVRFCPVSNKILKNNIFHYMSVDL